MDGCFRWSGFLLRVSAWKFRGKLAVGFGEVSPPFVISYFWWKKSGDHQLVNIQYFHWVFLHPRWFSRQISEAINSSNPHISGIRDAYFSPKSWAFLRCFCNQPQGGVWIIPGRGEPVESWPNFMAYILNGAHPNHLQVLRWFLQVLEWSGFTKQVLGDSSNSS